MLRDLIIKELSSKECVRIGRDEIEAAINEVTETIDWCSSKLERELCLTYAELIRDLINGLSIVRLRKSLISGVKHESLDSDILSRLHKLLKRFYELLLGGFVSNDGRTAVVTIKSIPSRERLIPAGSLVLIPVVEAVILESLGLVSILGGIND